MKRLDVTMIPIDGAVSHPDNPRIHDLAAIADSLARFGQTKPIIVQKSTGYVVAGNGTRIAARDRLGWTEIAALVVDLNDEEAKAYLAADNRASDRAKYDTEQLFQLLEGLADLDGTGFDIDYVETLGDSLGAHVVPDTDTGEVSKVPAPVVRTPGERRSPTEPMRDIVMLMTVSRAAAFGEKVALLRKAYGTSTVVDTVERALDEAVGRLS